MERGPVEVLSGSRRSTRRTCASRSRTAAYERARTDDEFEAAKRQLLG